MASPASTAANPPAPRRRLWPWLLGLLLALLLAMAGGAWWLLKTDSGLEWLLSRVPGLTVEGRMGRPDGGAFSAERVQWTGPTLAIAAEGLAWRDLQWRLRPHPGAWLRIELDAPTARSVTVRTTPGPASAAPPTPPADLWLPLEVVVRGLAVQRLQVNEQPPVTALAGDLHLGDDRGAAHRIERLSATWNTLRLDAQGRVATTGDLALRAELGAASAADAPLPWQARVQASGRLAEPVLDAALTAAEGAQARVQATLAPFAAWPVQALAASTHALDLQALLPSLPATQLSGRLVIDSTGADRPITADIDLQNAAPGPWDAGRLPLRTLQAAVRGSLQDRRTLELPSFSAVTEGGTVAGSARWEGHGLQATLQLDGLRPARLDARAPAMLLNGPLTLKMNGLPAPDGSAATEPLAGRVQADLGGRLDAARRPVQLQADAGFALPADGSLVAEVSRLVASAGGARAQVAGTFTRNAAQAWRVRSEGTLARFDPALWWRTPALQRGRHDLNASWTSDLTLPARLSADPRALLLALRGTTSVDITPSRLAGVPLEGRARLEASGPGALVAELQAAGNRAAADVQVAPGGSDRAVLTVDAPALAALSPLATLVPGLAAQWPRAGRVRANARFEGRWPDVQTEGEFHAEGLAGEGWAVERIDGTLAGTLAAHRLELMAASPVRPPAWVNASPGGTSLRLQLAGGWQAAQRTWRGRVGELLVAPREGGAAAWAAVRDIDAVVTLSPQGGVQRAELAPGSASLLGATLRWQAARYDATPGAPRLQLDARLDPLPIVPWLARLQPAAGWSGDLEIGGRAVVSSGGRFGAEVVIERTAGDLAIVREGRRQALGLTALRLALSAQNGRWVATQALTGTQVGVLAGSQTVRADPAAAWPAPQSPIEGVITLQTPDLDVWSPWLPAGWRVGGDLRLTALLSGTFGAPQYSGRAEGQQLAVSNLLEGVDLADGTLAIALRGTDAVVETLRFQGGEGTLQITGGASFGEAPRATLRAVATQLQVLGRVDRRIVASGNATLALQGNAIALDGSFRVDEGLIDISQGSAAQLDADVVVVNRPGSAPRPATEAPPRAPVVANARVDLLLDLGDDLQLRGRGIDTRLAGRLRVTTPEGRLAVDGVVRTVAGTYAAYGQNLAIERGVIRFAGELAAPTLDILAVRPDIDTRVGVVIIGTAVNPRVRLYSEPDMSDLDKLSWLVTGRASGGLGSADTALLQQAALALLAGEKGGGGSAGLVKRLGLDELSLGQTGTGDARDTVVTLGKQISQRLFIGYERGLNATAGSWQLIYRVARRFTVRASSGDESALDVIWTWRWN